MLVVKVKENESIDKALKRLKNKFRNVGVLDQLRTRQAFVKPSVKRRKQVIKATYIQQLHANLAKNS